MGSRSAADVGLLALKGALQKTNTSEGGFLLTYMWTDNFNFAVAPVYSLPPTSSTPTARVVVLEESIDGRDGHAISAVLEATADLESVTNNFHSFLFLI